MNKKNKFIIWCVVVAVTSFWMWVGVDSWFQDSLFEFHDEGVSLAMAGILFVVLLSCLSLALVLFRNKLWSTYLGLIVGATYMLVFGISNLALLGVFVLIILFVHAQDIVHGEVDQRLKMNSRLLIKKGLRHFLIGFFILISFAAFQSPAIEEFKDIEQLPSSTEIFVSGVVEQTIGSRIEDSGDGQKELVLNQIAGDTLSEINTFLNPYFEYAPPALAFGLFLVLWGVGWVFFWLAVFLGILIFWVLKRINFITIGERDIKAETIIV